MKKTEQGKNGSPLLSSSGLSIRQRTVLGYAGIAAITVLVCLLALIHMNYAGKTVDIAFWQGERMEEIYSLQLSWSSMMSAIDRMLITRQTFLVHEEVFPAGEEIGKQLISLNDTFAADDRRSILAELASHIEMASAAVDSICASAMRGEWATAQVIRHTDLAFIERLIRTELNQISVSTEQEVRSRVHSVKTAQKRIQMCLAIAALLVFILGTLWAYLTARSLVHPVEYLARAVRSLNPEGLSTHLQVSRHDEIGELASAFNAMTERLHSALNGLRGEKEKYRSLFQHSPISLWQIQIPRIPDTAVNANELAAMAEVTDVNKATRKLLAVHGELRPEQYGEILVDNTRDDIAAALSAFARGESIHSSETTLLDTEGNTRYVAAHFSVLPCDESDSRRILLSLIDITARKKAETALKESEEQYYHAQKLEAVGRLTGGIAHDFNNLLTVIINNCDIALMSKGIPRDVSEHIQQIKGASSRAAEVTEQLLAFSRQQVSNPVLLDLNQLVENIARMLRRLIGENIELAIELEQDVPPVEADPGQIEQVLMNLAVNARDAMPEGGRLRVATGKAVLKALGCSAAIGMPPGEYAVVTVSDTGCGMTGETMEKIFDPFFTTKEVGRGTGLGLASVHGIVTNSGGCIDVKSSPGQGTTFHVFLPGAHGEPRQLPEKAEEKSSSRGNETILLVEDEAGVREIAAKALRYSGYTVIEAEDGSDAIEAFRQNHDRIEILVSDVVLPGKLNGIDIAKLLRKRNTRLGILLMSGYVQEAITRSGGLPDNSVFVSKPFSLNVFLEKVREAIDKT